MFAAIRDCSFVYADLTGAAFNGAHLEWTTEHPADLGVWHEYDDGSVAFEQTHIPPFSRAELSNTSFVNTRFKNADFRDAEGLLNCDFTGARGLETCLFDSDEKKDEVLKMSRQNRGKE